MIKMRRFFSRVSGRALILALATGGALSSTAFGQMDSIPGPVAAPAKEPPTSWIDPDTGHRVHRMTTEPNSTGFYFNVNAFTPDGKEMVYSAPDGIHVIELASDKTRMVVAGGAPGTGPAVRAIVVGRKTPTVFFSKMGERAVYSANIDTGEIKKLADLPARGNVSTVNADETLAAGTYIEGSSGQDYGANRVLPPGQSGPLVQPLNKARMMEERLAAHLPLVLYTIDLQTGKVNTLLHSTDWINHLLFSPADPALLMYCHEGPWHKVDRIWNIHTDGTGNELIHKRTMAMEIAGHEFWGIDGKTLWYDLQTPKGEDFWLAGYTLATGERRWYHMERNEWSIHFNVTADESLFCGDGGDPGQVAKAPDGEWIELFHPEMVREGGVNEKNFVQPGVFRSERLVNMSKHNYRLEPNVRFSPDKKMIYFTSNMFGPSYVFGVEVAKAQ